jgi:uncharacterized alkaline shock family protein YloU
MAIKYGRLIPRITEAVRHNVVNHLENMTGLREREAREQEEQQA